MTFHLPTYFAAATHPEEMAAIRDPAVPAVIWRRNPPARFLSWLDMLPVDLLPKTRVIVRRETVSDAVINACDVVGMPHGLERDFLVEDVVKLSDVMFRILMAPCLRLRLDVMEGDGCPRFHIDHVAARLLCTYRGAGTDVRHGGRVHSLLTGDVVLMRGTAWPGGADGAEHRSPPRVASSQARLLLAIDPIFDPEDAI